MNVIKLKNSDAAIGVALDDNEIVVMTESAEQLPEDFSGQIVTEGLDAIRYYSDKTDTKNFSHLISLRVIADGKKCYIQSRHCTEAMRKTVAEMVEAGAKLKDYRAKFVGITLSVKPDSNNRHELKKTTVKQTKVEEIGDEII